MRIALPGDANLDGAVDALDWNIWNANKFQSATDWGRADFNGDGVTDGSDFNIWSENRFSAAIARLNPARQPQAAPVADRNESGAPAAHDVAVEALTIDPSHNEDLTSCIDQAAMELLADQRRDQRPRKSMPSILCLRICFPTTHLSFEPTAS